MNAQTPSLAATLSRFVSRLFARPQVVPADGVVLGSENGKPVVDGSMSPVLVVGPCRIGKTSAVVVPALLTWRKSAVVLDVQGEVEAVTAMWRKAGAGNKVRSLDFTATEPTESYNPLDTVRSGTDDELSDLKLIAEVLLPGTDTEAHQLARDALVCLMHTSKRAGSGLAGVLGLLNAPDALGSFLKDWAVRSVVTQAERFAVDSASAYFRAGYEDRLGVNALLSTVLRPFSHPILANNTATSTFKLAELRHPGAAQTLFVKVKPSDLERVAPLLKILFSQIAMTGDEKAGPLLMVIDDMASIGPLHNLHDELHKLSQRGIKLIAVAQAVSQIEAQYGIDSKFWPCDVSPLVRLAFGPREHGEIQRLSAAVARSGLDRIAPVVGNPDQPQVVVFRKNTPAKYIQPLHYFDSRGYRERAAGP